MPCLEFVHVSSHRLTTPEGRIEWARTSEATVRLPLLFWSDGKPWREANSWLRERSADVDPKTVFSNAESLKAYAKWLEAEKVDWRHFPMAKKERCLWRYRGALVRQRDAAKIAPSTASGRIRIVVQFYRWLLERRLIDSRRPLWQERHGHVLYSDSQGFARMMNVASTDLAIPNRKVNREGLEDGVLPVSTEARNEILAFVEQHGSRELHLMMLVAFFTGMRLGTIADLSIQTIANAAPDWSHPDLFRLSLGPRAQPPVRTKYKVSGQVTITRNLLEKLKEFSSSPQRLKREALAARGRKDLLFLTKHGNSYADPDRDRSPAINVELHRLRKLAKKKSLSLLDGFKFHQTRATFATQLTVLALAHLKPLAALAFVRQALLHKNEATTLKYIRFVETQPVKEKWANAFTREFLGLLSGGKNDE